MPPMQQTAESGGDQRRLKSPLPPPEQQEHLPCPRCDSTNTKFCYYNNYNFSQPRHFCKSCRRYWTQGGTLRDIPVGGATRKSAKRSRTLPPHPQTSESLPLPSMAGSFTSLLNSSATSLALGGLGLGIGPGFDDSSFGPLGRALWAFPEVAYFTTNATGAAVTTTGVDVGPINAWQLDTATDQAAAAGGFVAADCFPSWPELAISTPGNGLK